ncbi:MAG: PASTA domain-containing protein [Actinomycetes bacterium]
MSKVLGGRYELGEMIGTGGMADVYIGEDLRLSRKVAIKILRSDLARDPSFLARFRKEALAAAGLNHPGIVAVYDSGEEGSNSYIVMELVKGLTLREIIHGSEKLTVRRSLEIVAGILEALSYSHANGIIHRDIKPGNIMVTDEGDVKVMDFGIARALDDIGATMTNTWNVVGTAQYLSPEQATGEVADRRSDIYSVGCLLYEILTGRPPFSGDTPVSIAYQHVSMPFALPSEIIPTLDESFDSIISIALAKDPAHRYQSAADMLQDINQVLKGQTVATRIILAPTKVNIKRRLIIASLILAFAAAVVSGTILSIHKTPRVVATIVVPNVLGLTQDQATGYLGNFTVTIAHAVDPTIPKGRIARQLPVASTKVAPGSSVTLTLSDGPGETTVPVNLVGLTLTEARSLLASAGLVVSQTLPVDSNQQPGVVLAVTPTGGSSLPAGSGVILQIASGKIQVPLLVGLTEIEAKTLLTQAGFQVVSIDATDETQAVGNVLAQAPDAGTTLTIGSSVTITVNRAQS